MHSPQQRVLLTVRQFAERNPAFSQASIRHLINLSEERERTKGKLPGNGLKEAGALLKCGRRIVIDEERFFNWLDERNGVPSQKEVRP